MPNADDVATGYVVGALNSEEVPYKAKVLLAGPNKPKVKAVDIVSNKPVVEDIVVATIKTLPIENKGVLILGGAPRLKRPLLIDVGTNVLVLSPLNSEG